MRKIVLGALFLGILWAGISCSPSPQDTPSLATVEKASVVQAQDFAPGQLEAHYLKHRLELGAISQEQYLSGARDLLNARFGKDVLEKRRTNGDILHYRISTGEFAVMTYNGRIRTYFKTDYQYWLKQ